VIDFCYPGRTGESADSFGPIITGSGNPSGKLRHVELIGEVAQGCGDSAAERGKYGIDGGVIVIPVFGALEVGLASIVLWAIRHRKRGIARLAGIVAMAGAGSAASYLYSTSRGKFAVWAEVLDGLYLGGDENVLDVGCGRGAVLLLAAHRLPEGRAVGADIWRRQDQSGNSRAAAEHNAAVEGVRDRVDLVNADARDLPFRSASFDVVVSSLTIHNIPGSDGRRQALYEAVRVLRAGGRLRIVDLPNADWYPEVLRDAGCINVTVRRLDWRTWFGVPGHHQTLVAATKAYD
jgi:SAM-dependent methyltransferase